MEEKLPKTGFSLNIAERKGFGYRQESPTKDDIAKELQEENIRICFIMPDKTRINEKFRRGQTIGYLKNYIDCEYGIPADSQTLYLGEKILLDPLTLTDYPELENEDKVDITVLRKRGFKE